MGDAEDPPSLARAARKDLRGEQILDPMFDLTG
jgi:hypothetical protein